MKKKPHKYSVIHMLLLVRKPPLNRGLNAAKTVKMPLRYDSDAARWILLVIYPLQRHLRCLCCLRLVIEHSLGEQGREKWLPMLGFWRSKFLRPIIAADSSVRREN